MYLRYTLLCDGTSDNCLQEIINWSIKDLLSVEFLQVEPQKADFSYEKVPPKTLTEKIALALEKYPCDVLFIHRDAENANPENRCEEINHALSSLQEDTLVHVPIVPIRMMEAWLLISEDAIRRAADNPNGEKDLSIPTLKRLEQLPDPKRKLYDVLITASDKNGRRLNQFKRDIPKRIHRVSRYIKDFSKLRQLSAFQQFEKDLKTVLQQLQR